MPSAEGAHLIFPEFLNLNTMQPLHQHRIQSKGLDEARYINHIFNARVSSMQHQLAHLDGASLTFNVDPSLKPLVQFNR